MGEGSLYAPEHAALAVLQSEGDSFEAAFLLRAYRATLERRYYSEILNTRRCSLSGESPRRFERYRAGRFSGLRATIRYAC